MVERKSFSSNLGKSTVLFPTMTEDINNPYPYPWYRGNKPNITLSGSKCNTDGFLKHNIQDLFYCNLTTLETN